MAGIELQGVGGYLRAAHDSLRLLSNGVLIVRQNKTIVIIIIIT